MDFQIPSEFTDFVSSAEDLLKQFNTASFSDKVSFQIYLDEPCNVSVDQNLENLLSVRNELLRLSSKSTFKSYIWHLDPFRINLYVDHKNCPPYTFLGGELEYGENIEDEWFLVYLLVELSKLKSDISICIRDSDGEFLLAEAAEYIPEWIGPENSTNRVWVRDGKLHIIAIDEAGKDKHGGMKLLEALKAMKTSCKSFVVDKSVEKIICQRTSNAYPARIRAVQHNTVCVLPFTLACMLQQHPELIAIAVNSFCVGSSTTNRTPSQKLTAKDSKLLKKFGRHLDFTTQSSSSSSENLTAVQLKFSRALYAQLMYVQFRPPMPCHNLVRAASSTNSAPLILAVDIGCRLLCGLEMSYQGSLRGKCSIDSMGHFVSDIKSGQIKKQPRNSIISDMIKMGTVSSSPPQSLIQNLQQLIENNEMHLRSSSVIAFNNDLLSDELHDDQNQEHCPASIADRYSMFFLHSPFHQFVDTFEQTLRDSVPQNSSSSAGIDTAFSSIINGTLTAESDAWLYMTLEEMDIELNSRMETYRKDSEHKSDTKESTEEPSTTNESVANSNESITTSTQFAPQKKIKHTSTDGTAGDNEDSLQNIVDGFKTFFKGKSEFDGYQNSTNNSTHLSSNSESPFNTLEDVMSPNSTDKPSELSSVGVGTFILPSKSPSKKIIQKPNDPSKNTNTTNDLKNATMNHSNRIVHANNDSNSDHDSDSFFSDTDYLIGDSDDDTDDEDDIPRGNSEDVSDDGDNDKEDRVIMEEYWKIMDQQLFNMEGSTLGATFETKTKSNTTKESRSTQNDAEIPDLTSSNINGVSGMSSQDMEYHLLKNIMESHSYQYSNGMLPGPAGQLLSQLNEGSIKLPTAPAVWSQSNDIGTSSPKDSDDDSVDEDF